MDNNNNTSQNVNTGDLEEVDISIDNTSPDTDVNLVEPGEIDNVDSDVESVGDSEGESGGEGEGSGSDDVNQIQNSFIEQIFGHFKQNGMFNGGNTSDEIDDDDDDSSYSGSGPESDIDPFEMKLEIRIVDDDDDGTLAKLYQQAAEKHNEKMVSTDHYDSGFDLFCPKELIIPKESAGVKLDLGIQCAAYVGGMDAGHFRPSPYFMYPRSSISKTPLRLANNVGIIDTGYRGNLIGMFDKLPLTFQERRYAVEVKRWSTRDDSTDIAPETKPSGPFVREDDSYVIEKHQRLLQICAPNLGRIYVEVVDELDHTERGSGGFGSTGV